MSKFFVYLLTFLFLLNSKIAFGNPPAAAPAPAAPTPAPSTVEALDKFHNDMNAKIKALAGPHPGVEDTEAQARIADANGLLTQYNTQATVAARDCRGASIGADMAAALDAVKLEEAIQNHENEKKGKSWIKKTYDNVTGGASTLAREGRNNFKSAQGKIQAATTQCFAAKKKCFFSDGGGDLPRVADGTSKLYFGSLATSEAGKELAYEIYKNCTTVVETSSNELKDKLNTISGLKDSATATEKALITGGALGATAIVGGIMYKNKQDDKEEKEKKQKLKKEIENGIARKEDGSKTNCLTPGTFGNAECKPILQQYCAKDENAQKGGCVAFQNKVCSEADASQSYCVGKDVKAYCKQEGPLIAQSPACVWVSSRPKSCDTEPENIQCLAAMSPAQLSAECPKFPNDPLCQAHLAGKVVTQPMTESQAAEYSSTGTSNAGGLNNIISSSDQSSITSQSNWKSTSSAYKKLCSNKQLRGCN